MRGIGTVQASGAGHPAEFRKVVTGLARAFAGALIFALPMLMTMELWQIGYSIPPWRLLILIALMIPLLVGVSAISGFEDTETWTDDVADAFVGILVAALTSAATLWLFRIITVDMPVNEVIGKIAIQTFPGSIGAMLARDQLAGEREGRNQQAARQGRAGQLLLMAIGALFLGLNVAPTEEMILLSYLMSPGHELALALVSLALMYSFVYAAGFPGTDERRGDAAAWRLFVGPTVTGYALVLVISIFLLWVFGRTDHTGLQEIVSAAVVLGFPSAIGAAAARLIL